MMSFLNHENVSYSVQALLVFLNISKQSKSLKEQDADQLCEKCLELLENLALKRIEPEQGVLVFNALIEQLNHFLTAPYPSIPMDTVENFVKGEIVAFEHYLNQELKANHLTVQEEAPLFHHSLSLWEQVGIRLSAQEGAAELRALIEKLNHLLPENERYPRPE